MCVCIYTHTHTHTQRYIYTNIHALQLLHDQSILFLHSEHNTYVLLVFKHSLKIYIYDDYLIEKSFE